MVDDQGQGKVPEGTGDMGSETEKGQRKGRSDEGIKGGRSQSQRPEDMGKEDEDQGTGY